MLWKTWDNIAGIGITEKTKGQDKIVIQLLNKLAVIAAFMAFVLFVTKWAYSGEITVPRLVGTVMISAFMIFLNYKGKSVYNKHLLSFLYPLWLSAMVILSNGSLIEHLGYFILILLALILYENPWLKYFSVIWIAAVAMATKVYALELIGELKIDTNPHDNNIIFVSSVIIVSLIVSLYKREINAYGQQQNVLIKSLAKKNQELEQFSYITSHDLQEPLRTITSFSELLVDRYAKELDVTGVKSLNYIHSATVRMRNLIVDLLEHSLIGNKGQTDEIDMNRLVNEVKNDLGTNLQETGAVIKIADLPKVKGYFSDLQLLFMNLISNAIKFRKEGIKPLIQIKAKKTNGFWQFSVKDNGIGIAKEDHGKIFKIFQRLYTRDKYEGTGIGLAHCQKIAGLHGGELWVESELGKGSTFYFTIKR